MQAPTCRSIIPTVKNEKDSLGAKRAPRFLLALPDDIRQSLEKVSIANGRSLTAEINIRLRDSLRLYIPDLVVEEGGNTTIVEMKKAPYRASVETTETERAMLAVFRSLPPEKQLALLSLFK